MLVGMIADDEESTPVYADLPMRPSDLPPIYTDMPMGVLHTSLTDKTEDENNDSHAATTSEILMPGTTRDGSNAAVYVVTTGPEPGVMVAGKEAISNLAQGFPGSHTLSAAYRCKQSLTQALKICRDIHCPAVYR
eukprot:984855-Prymnesium_polylepis.1